MTIEEQIEIVEDLVTACCELTNLAEGWGEELGKAEKLLRDLKSSLKMVENATFEMVIKKSKD